MYRISPDLSRNMVEVELGGLLTIEEVDRYFRDLRGIFGPGRLRAGYRILIDCSHCTVQSQDVVEAKRAHIAAMPKASRIAIVTPGQLARLQIKRLITQSYAEVFATVREAREWLASAPVTSAA